MLDTEYLRSDSSEIDLGDLNMGSSLEDSEEIATDSEEDARMAQLRSLYAPTIAVSSEEEADRPDRPERPESKQPLCLNECLSPDHARGHLLHIAYFCNFGACCLHFLT